MHPFVRIIPAVALLLAGAIPAAHAQGAADPAVTSDPTLYVATYVDAIPAQIGQAEALLRQLAAASHKEAGSVRYEVLQRIAPVNQFVILEIWKDQQSLDAHKPAAKAINDKLAPLLLAPIDERLCVAFNVAPPPNALPRNAIEVVTHVDIPGNVRDKIVVALKQLADATRKEAGILRYDITFQKARTNHFTVIEVWKDQKSYDAHEAGAAAKEFRGALTPLTGALYDRRLYKSL